jgi:hypothetical protein
MRAPTHSATSGQHAGRVRLLFRRTVGEFVRRNPPAIFLILKSIPPLLWLVSEAASGVTGSRFAANLWDAALPPEQAAEKSRTTAGWIQQTT